jgi:hypothetical protein
VIAKAAPSLCECLEGRLFLSVSSWVVTWSGTTPTSARLEAGSTSGQVRVFLNTNTTPTPDHLFSNTTGQDLILLGSLTNFTVIDKVTAKDKPGADAQGDKGVKVQGGGGGATLVLDASGRDGSNDPTHPNDTLIQVLNNDHIEVTDRSTSTVVDGFSYFGSGVSHLVIKTNNVDAVAARLPVDTEEPINYFDGFDDKSNGNFVSGEGTNVFINGLTSGIDVLVDTGATGTFNKVLIGQDSIVEQVTVVSGAGDDTVAVQRDNGDDSADVLVDFVYADELGLDNLLVVQSEGTVHLDNAPGQTDHPIYVDTVKVRGGGSGTRGELILEHEATIDDLDVEGYGILTIATDDAIVNSLSVAGNGELEAQAQATILDFSLDGTAFFNSSSAPSSIDTLDMHHNSVLNLDGDAEVSMDDELDKLTVDGHATINAPNGSTLTIQTAEVTNAGILTINLADEGAADVQVEGTFTVVNRLNVNDGGLLTVGVFAVSGLVSVSENAKVTVEGTSDINDLEVAGTEALVLFKATGTHVNNMSITDGGVVRLEPRPGVPESHPSKVLIIDNSLVLQSSGTTPTGTLDLTDNALIIDYGTNPYTTVRDAIIYAYHVGVTPHWDRPGISTSKGGTITSGTYGTPPSPVALGYADNANLGKTTFQLQTVDSTTVLVKWTFQGDADLDGKVNVTDLGLLGVGWQTNDDWWHGDYDYSGYVDITDLGLNATNWQKGVSGGPLFVGGDPEQEFLDGIEKLGLSEEEIAMLLEMLGNGGGDAL